MESKKTATQDVQLNKFDKVVIYLHSGDDYQGEILQSRNNCIQLKMRKSNKTVTIYYHEIKRVDKKVDAVQQNGVNMLNGTGITNGIKSTMSNLSQMLDIICNHVVISVNDFRYHKFLLDVKDCNLLGIASAGFINGRMSKPSLVAFNLDDKQIVVLDLVEMNSSKLNPFKFDLKSIFASTSTEKILHGAKFFVDYLTHRENITINHVFDTQVADVYVSKNGDETQLGCTPLSYASCLTKYVKLPDDVQNTHSKLETNDDIYKRPLNDDFVHSVAYNAAFLISLRNQLHSLVLKPFQENMKKHVYSMSDRDIVLAESTDDNLDFAQPGQLARASGRDADPPAIRCWVPPSIKSRHNVVIKDSNDIIFRKIRGILNKLTPDNFDKLANELVSFEINTVDRLKGLALLILQKATDEPKFSYLYAQLCKRLDEVLLNFNPPDQPSTFRNLLANTCENEFNNRSQKQDSDKKIYDEDEKKSRAKQKMLGNFKFIGELGRLEFVREAVLFDCIKLLLKEASRSSLPIEERCENLECMCQLLRICGRRLDADKGQWLMNQVFAQIEKLTNTKNFPKRIRFMLLDITELRMNHWAPRLVDLINNKGTATIDLIEQEDMKMYSSSNMNRLYPNRSNYSNSTSSSSSSSILNGYSNHYTTDNLNSFPDKFRNSINFKSNHTNGTNNASRFNNCNSSSNCSNNSNTSGVNSYNNQANNFRTYDNGRNNFSNFTNSSFQRNFQRNNYNAMKNSNEIAPRFKKNLLIASQGNLNDIELRPSANSMLFKQVPLKQSNQANSDNIPIMMMDNLNLNLNLNRKPEQDIPLAPIIVTPIPITAVTQSVSVSKGQKLDKNKQKKEKNLSKNDVVTKVVFVMNEYLSNKSDENEAIESLKSTKIPEKFYKDAITNLLVASLSNADDEDRKRAVQLVKLVQKYGLFNKSAFVDAFESLCSLYKSRESEKGSSRKIVNVVAHGLACELITLSHIVDVINNGKYHPLFLLIFQELSAILGSNDRVLKIFQSVKIDLLQVLPEAIRSKDKLADILEKYQLTFLQPLYRIQSQLSKQIKANPNPQHFYKWIKDNIDEVYYRDHGFINVLVAVIVHFIIQESTSNIQEASKLLERFKSVLQFFLEDRIDLQVVAIYSLQVYFYTNEQPKGTLLKWFVLLFNLEIIDGEAFLKWQDDINDEYVGKGEALFEVTHWITSWLQAAIADSDDDDVEMD